MYDELFKRKKLNKQKLIDFGFELNNGSFQYVTEILDGQFLLHVDISPLGSVDTKVLEKETNEEYVLYKTSAEGSFVGEVRSACEDILADISAKCYDIEIFKSQQAKSVIKYVSEKYGGRLEFLWQKFPDNAVWRRSDSLKWYGAILTVSLNKLGLDSNDIAEIIDLRYYPDKLGDLLNKSGYYLGWHMNKKHWYTVILDGTVADEELFRLIDISYDLAVK